MWSALIGRCTAAVRLQLFSLHHFLPAMDAANLQQLVGTDNQEHLNMESILKSDSFKGFWDSVVKLAFCLDFELLCSYLKNE